MNKIPKMYYIGECRCGTKLRGETDTDVWALLRAHWRNKSRHTGADKGDVRLLRRNEK